MRVKLDHENSNMYRCCFCCHVRTGTVILGLWRLLTQLLVLTILTVAMIHPEVLKDNMPGSDTSVTAEGDNLSCRFQYHSWFEQRSFTKGKSLVYGQTTAYDFLNMHGKWEIQEKVTLKGSDSSRTDLCVAQLLTFCMFIITLLLVYGAARGRPGYLMPFFCIQVFDFCLACLAAVGYFSYMPNVKEWMTCQLPKEFPLRENLLSMDGEWLMLLVVISFVLVLSLKAYLVGVVWSCYRYLQLTQASCSNVREFTVDPDTEMLLPPKYEDVIKMTNEQAPPPPYAPN
ncbi:lysosomal-associated transmembrane protein 4A-like [Liolophura sinensis]|uniref:lysosomal-associated transmembrane protein 4A-like n=1 Tax=Liolophura sinensis TaxID=3198878 RepID=UPI00315886FD